MTGLWEMNQQMLAIDNLLNENTDPETLEILEGAKAQLSDDIESKMENILGYISECKSRVAYYKAEEMRLAAKRRALEKRIDWLRDMVFGQLKSTGRKKAEYGSWNVSIAKSPDRVIVMDDALEYLPDDMCVISRAPNKTAIKDKISDDGSYSVEIDGKRVVLATLETGREMLRIG